MTLGTDTTYGAKPIEGEGITAVVRQANHERLPLRPHSIQQYSDQAC